GQWRVDRIDLESVVVLKRLKSKLLGCHFAEKKVKWRNRRSVQAVRVKLPHRNKNTNAIIPIRWARRYKKQTRSECKNEESNNGSSDTHNSLIGLRKNSLSERLQTECSTLT